MPVSSAELSRFAEEAGFIFRGRVTHQRTRAGEDPATGQMVAAEIEEILRSTDALRGLRGRIVTVVSENATSMEEEGSFLFFTNCLVLSDNIVVREVGHVRASREVNGDVADILRDAAERPLRERVARAQLIIEGHVTASGPADPDAIQKSEHDPDWWIAHVAVDSVIKGGGKSVEAVDVLFANSKDIAWYKSPKLLEGVRGIFLLHSIEQTDRPPKGRRMRYQATDPLDYLPAERLPEINRALNEKRNPE